LDLAFALCYTIEMAFKLTIMGGPMYFYGPMSGWHAYESLLIVVAWAELVLLFYRHKIAETNHSSIAFASLRILRLARFVRIARVARLPFFTELIMIINGARGGLRAFFWSQVLLAVPVYAVALLFRETLGSHASSGSGAENFASVGEAFFTCFRCLVVGDCSTRDGQPIFVLQRPMGKVSLCSIASCLCSWPSDFSM